jgi:gamma-glutamylcyclotransferase (GGCT)/AIG2-like uncharacterized protein YtfP
MINDLLFVYGTLLTADNEFARYLKHNSTVMATGSFTGRLYDVGEYPGAVIDDKNSYPIKGVICKLNNADALATLDDYEGYGDNQDQPNLFIRKLLPVETVEGSVNCWIYLYNLPVDGLSEIKSGNYKSYLKQK